MSVKVVKHGFCQISSYKNMYGDISAHNCHIAAAGQLLVMPVPCTK